MTRRTTALDKNYSDDGCNLSPKCLTCTLELGCKYDKPTLQNGKRQARKAKALALQAQDRARTEIAAQLGVTLRTVYRYLRETPQQAT